MARLVLLFVEDNNDAEQLTELLATKPPSIVVESNDAGGGSFISRLSVEAIGMYMVPTKFCSCAGVGDPNKAKSVDGQKFGLRIHRACGLPYPFEASGQAPKNLLKDETKGFRDFWIYFYPQRLLRSVRAKV